MMGVSFLGNTVIPETSIDVLNDTLATVKQQSEERNKSLVKALNKVNKDIADMQPRLNAPQSPDFEYLNKLSFLLNARRQTLIRHQELLRELVTLLEQHILLLKGNVEGYEEEKPKPRVLYAWNDLCDAQEKYTEHQLLLDTKKGNLDTIARYMVSERESLASLQKQLDAKSKLVATDVTVKAGAKRSTLKNIADIFEQETNLLNEKIELSKLKSEKLAFEEKYKLDEINSLTERLADEHEFLSQIERRLLLTPHDVTIAKTAWNNEVQNALQKRDELNRIQEEKSAEKERLNIDLEFMREKIKQIKGGEEADTIADALVRSNLQKLTAQQWLLDKEIQTIETKKDIADVLAKLKELQYQSIEMRYKLKNEYLSAHDFTSLLENFRNQRDLEASNFRSFKEKQHEAVASLIENKRIAEEIKQKIEKFKGQQASVFRGKEASLETILGNYDDTRHYLAQLTQNTQDFFAVNSKLLEHQAVILKSYAWIISNLESQKTIQGIWQRSVHAISFKTFLMSLYEADSTGKRFFWETPAHFSPTLLWTFLKGITWSIFLSLLLFLFLFVVGFYTTKLLLQILQAKLALLNQFIQSSPYALLLKSIVAMLLFAQTYFTPLFVLLFFYLHLAIARLYIPWLLTPYNGALCHLITIPMLLYLAHALINRLKEFNQKSRYVLVTKRYENRFITLISLFFYATAILIPLRFAFLAYTVGQKTVFGDILMAAYSLFVLLIILFFFSKEDILQVIPTHTTFLIWLKRKIEKYYYPVFFFIMSLLILSNHSIGYYNLAWYLAFAVPLTVALLYALFFVHNYIRKYSIFLFMQEDEDEIRDKFEHAKTYYGFFIIATFLFLVFVAVLILARIWEFDFMPADFWQVLSEKWVVRMSSGEKFGFVQFMILIFFVVGGFLISSLMHKFVFNKLFDILRTEPGLQNTISRISHYVILGLAFLFGLVNIHVDTYLILTVGSLLIVGLGLALKDVLTDFLGGFLMLLERPIEIGNYIEIDEFVGTVHKIAARTTTLVTSKNHSIVIPNREFLSKALTNWGHGRFAVGFEIQVRVRHDADPDLVKRTLFTVVQGNPIVLRVPSVVVRLEDFEENALYFLVRAFISSRRVKDQWEIAAQLRLEILKAFKEHGIKLAVPSLISADSQGTQVDETLAVKFKNE